MDGFHQIDTFVLQVNADVLTVPAGLALRLVDERERQLLRIKDRRRGVADLFTRGLRRARKQALQMRARGLSELLAHRSADPGAQSALPSDDFLEQRAL